jgi:hypothetical protein
MAVRVVTRSAFTLPNDIVNLSYRKVKAADDRPRIG